MIESVLLAVLVASDSRSVLPLDGSWSITSGDPSRRDSEWRPVTVPEAFESALGDDYDGIATYRTEFIPPKNFAGERFFLEFDAVATDADVFLNGDSVGRHLGPWTRFRCDVTAKLKKGFPNLLQVVVDEKVGHDTQGFLTIVEPHFGGIWQSVRLVGESAPCFDDDAVLTFGDYASRKLLVEAPLLGDRKGARVQVTLDLGTEKIVRDVAADRVEIEVGDVTPWEPLAPKLYPVTLALLDAKSVEIDRIERSVGFRTLVGDGRRMVLNGHPLNVRGILEWGYYPPQRTPNRDLEDFERQVREAQARGFNLIKFCLWMPPRRLLDAMDRLGMLAWIEYPTWHPSFAEATRPALFAEFDEFFRHDRSHASVIVRSLTCETGPSAPLEVMQELYARAHRAIPNAFVEDDSSWIAWNRVHDFYDDHPYGNNDTWPSTLARLELYISERKPMPLLLGEAIAADTWLDRATVREAETRFRPLAIDALEAWETRFADRYGAARVPDLTTDSLRYCLNQRKDQIEAFRALQPDSGYVVSVARDFRLASMGLADAFDRWKWRVDEWAWHGDTMLLLAPGSPRSVKGGAHFALPIVVAHHGRGPLPAGVLRWRFGEEDEGTLDHGALAPGSVTRIGQVELSAPDVTGAYLVPFEVRLGSGADEQHNSWPIYVVPVFDAETEVGDPPSGDAAPDADTVIEADALTTELLDRLEAGARVLLTTSAAPGSFVADERWTLRGTLWMADHPLVTDLTRSFFTDLCVKDLHPEGMIPLAELFDFVDPIVGFVDAHDVAITTDYGFLFETKVGEGRLVVSALPLSHNPAADFLRHTLREHLIDGDEPTRALPPELIGAMRARLVAETIDLTSREWQFRPEPEGATPGEWKPIHIGKHWEAEGYDTLDGVARYRLDVELPEAWIGKPLYLNVDGADDAYWIEWDGAAKGEGGDVANRKTAFDTKASHKLEATATPGRHVLEIKVLDWYGAGGLHRPISISTAPIGAGANFLRAR